MASSAKALARAVTKRARRSEPQSPPRRAITVRYPAGTINRSLISLPTELISTTNVHALTAPDIRNISSSSSGSSINSNNDSEFSTIDRSFLSSSATTPDSSSIASSPVSPITPASDDAKGFFDAGKPIAAIAVYPAPSAEAPAIPNRAPSHSKKAHIELSRKRSIQRMSPPPITLNRPATVRDSADIFTTTTDPNHPFGRELAQVDEIAEEFGGAKALLDEEEQEMLSKGLCKFAAEDYLNEIGEPYGGVFEDQLGTIANPWI